MDNGAIEWLPGRATPAGCRPFRIVVGYMLPHCPFVCPKHLFGEYYAKADIARMSEEERANGHPAMKQRRELRGVDGVPDEAVRTARAAYCGLVTMTDTHVAEVLDALEAAGLSERQRPFTVGTTEIWRALSARARAVRPPDPDHRLEPAGANLFPES